MRDIAIQQWFDSFLDYSNDNISNYHYEKSIINWKIVYNILDQNNNTVASISKDDDDYSIMVKYHLQFLINDFHLNKIIDKCTKLLVYEYWTLNIVIKWTISQIVESSKNNLRLVSKKHPSEIEISWKSEIDSSIRFFVWSLQKTYSTYSIDVRLLNLWLDWSTSKYIPIRLAKINNNWQVIRVWSNENCFEDFVVWNDYGRVVNQIIKTLDLLYPNEFQEQGIQLEDIPFDITNQNNEDIFPTIKEELVNFIDYDEFNIIINLWENWIAKAYIINELWEVIAEAKETFKWWKIISRNCWDETCENIIEKLAKLWAKKQISNYTKSITKETDFIPQKWLFDNLWIQIDPRRGWNQLIVWSHFEEFVAKTFNWEIIDKAWNFPDISVDIPQLWKTFFEVKSVCHGNYFLIKLDQLAGFSTINNIFYTLIVYKDTTPWFVRWKKRTTDNKIVKPENLEIESVYILPAKLLREFILNSMLNDKIKLKKLTSKWSINQKVDIPASILHQFLKSQEAKTIWKLTYLWIDLEQFHEKFL